MIAAFEFPADADVPDALARALEHAERGWPVFPVRPGDKSPYVQSWPAQATKDPKQIHSWWTAWPDAMIGSPTGAASGFWALDIDDDPTRNKAGFKTVEQLGWDLDQLLATVAVRTPSGGLHLYFRWSPDAPVRNTGAKIGQWIDVRGEGGYVVLAGSRRADGARYTWENPIGLFQVERAPAWLTQAALSASGKTRARPELVEPARPEGGSLSRALGLHDRYAEAALRDECWRVAHAREGERNITLNNAAFNLGTFVGAGRLALERVGMELLRAAADYIVDHSEEAARKTIESGLTAGMQSPREALATPAHERPPPEEAPRACASAFTADQLAGRPRPRRIWNVPGLIPNGTAITIDGDGGTGKSTLALQLGVATVLGKKWLNRDVLGGRCLYLSAEDDKDELHRRLEDMCVHFGAGLEDLAGLTLWPLNDATELVVADNRKSEIVPTALWHDFVDKVGELKPVLIVLDSRADVFGGDEIIRRQVRGFVSMLRELARSTGAGIVLLSHPSRGGMADGSGTSGSTAWNNSVRSRLYLSKPRKEEAGYDPDARILTLMKANYGPEIGELRLSRRGGVFVTEDKGAATPLDAMVERKRIDSLFLELLTLHTEQGLDVSPNPGNKYAPVIFAEHPRAIGAVRKSGFRMAMMRLLEAKTIRVEEHGPPSKRRHRLVRV